MKFNILVIMVSSFLTQAALAQCTKDIECKGDRICENGICMSLQSNQVAPSVLQRMETKSEYSLNTDKVSIALENQLSCKTNPEPAKTLRFLRSLGYIGMRPKFSVDGMNIFEIKKPLTVFGYKVLEVSGWEEVEDKTLFWRGPGTAPPKNVLAVVEGNHSLLAIEIATKVGSGPNVSKATYSKYAQQATDIMCYEH